MRDRRLAGTQAAVGYESESGGVRSGPRAAGPCRRPGGASPDCASVAAPSEAARFACRSGTPPLRSAPLWADRFSARCRSWNAWNSVWVAAAGGVTKRARFWQGSLALLPLFAGLAGASDSRAGGLALRAVVAPGHQVCSAQLRAQKVVRAELKVSGAILFEPVIVSVLAHDQSELGSRLTPIVSITTPPPPSANPNVSWIELTRESGFRGFFPGRFQICAGNPRANQPLSIELMSDVR